MKKMLSRADSAMFQLLSATAAPVLSSALAPLLATEVQLAAVPPGSVVIIAAPLPRVRDGGVEPSAATAPLMRRRGDSVQTDRMRRAVDEPRSALALVSRMPVEADRRAAARAAVSLYTRLAAQYAQQEQDARRAYFVHVDLRA
jgi:hypothetical protein